jgi:hypothetical protein
MFDSSGITIPDPESSDGKEVFAFVGLALYQAQLLEQEVLLFAAMLNLSNSPDVTTKYVNDLFDRLDAKPLGALLGEARDLTSIPSDLDATLGEALKTRNRLAHHFFVEHDVDFMSAPGRAEMIEQLRTMTAGLRTADQSLTKLRWPLAAQVGITLEQAEAELQRLKNEAEARG